MKRIVLPDGQMVKAGWVAPPDESYGGTDFLTEEVFDDVKESGVNLLFCVINPIKREKSAERFARLCKERGIYFVVSDGQILSPDFDIEKYKSLIGKYKEWESVFGINVCDEPGRNRFELIAKRYRILKPYLGGLVFYVNHMPLYATFEQLNGGWWTPDMPADKKFGYDEFLGSYCRETGGDLLSYDFYPFRSEKGICDPRYFSQLSLARSLAEKYDMALWNFTQVVSWDKDAIRNMTYSEIAWLNNTSLAYGVNGLQYFCYWTPMDAGGESFLNAMVSRSGRKTQRFYFVKDLNSKIDKIAPHLLSARHIGVVASGDTLAPVPEKDILSGCGTLLNVDGAGSITGCFENDAKRFYFTVNLSLFEPRLLSHSFTDKRERAIVSGLSELKSTDKKIDLLVSPGESVLIYEDK